MAIYITYWAITGWVIKREHLPKMKNKSMINHHIFGCENPNCPSSLILMVKKLVGQIGLSHKCSWLSHSKIYFIVSQKNRIGFTTSFFRKNPWKFQSGTTIFTPPEGPQTFNHRLICRASSSVLRPSKKRQYHWNQPYLGHGHTMGCMVNQKKSHGKTSGIEMEPAIQ